MRLLFPMFLQAVRRPGRIQSGGNEVPIRDCRLAVLIVLVCLLSACMLPERAGRETVVDIPLLATWASADEGDAWGLNLLLGIFQADVHDGGSHGHFFPLYFNTEGPEDDSFLLLFPFYYHRREPFREDIFYFLFGRQRIDDRVIYHPLFPIVRYSPADAAGRSSFFLLPLVDIERDGRRGSLNVLNILGLVSLFDRTWGFPPEPGGSGERGSFAFLNVLNIFRLAGGNDLGEYEDFQIATLWASEKISFFQRHWRRDGGDGRTVLFPLYWHFRDDEGECRHFWPFFSTSGGDGWSRFGLLSEFFSLKNEGGKKTMKLFWFIPISWGGCHTTEEETP